MKNFIFLFCLILSGSTMGQDSVRFKVVMGGELISHVNVKIKGNPSESTTDGMVAFKRPWYYSSKKGKKVKVIVWLNGDFPYPKQVRWAVLDTPVSIIDCTNERLRLFCENLRDAERIQKVLETQKSRLWDSCHQIKPRLVTYINSHEVSSMGYYNSHLDSLIIKLIQLDTRLRQEAIRLASIKQRMQLSKFAETELDSNRKNQQDIQKQETVCQTDLEEIKINLENAPDNDVTNNELGFKPSRFEITDTVALKKYVETRINTLKKLNTRFFKGRSCIILVQVAGFADFKPYPPDNSCNSGCSQQFINIQDCNQCLSWKRANNVHQYLRPSFQSLALGNLRDSVIGKGNELALEEALKQDAAQIGEVGEVVEVKDKNGKTKKILYDEKKQQKWRKFTISVNLISKKIYDTYAKK